MRKITLFTILLLASLGEWSCESVLDERPYSELDKSVVQTENGIKALLFSSYRSMQNGTPTRWIINTAEVTTDIGYNTGGAENLGLSQLINFTWDASLGTLIDDVWGPNYRCIRDANLVLENLPGTPMDETRRKQFAAEAKVLRAYSYDFLYRWFGRVPVRTSSTSPTNLERASDEEVLSLIESDLLEAVPDLPDPGAEEAFGRINKGVAWGLLAKFYLNTRQWQKASDAASNVIDFNYYQLFADATKIFTVANEGNKEMILVIPCLNIDGYGNWYTAGAMPPNFKTSTQIPEFTWVTGMANFATQYRLRSAFVNTYDFANDKRAVLILRTYTNIAGNTVDLMTTADNARCMKYWDNATAGNHSGNDVPLIRYADILLTKAEAMNELDGPTQEALDLINEVRTRAGIADLTLADATDKDVLRDLILRERAWEFVGEGKRREDLIRHGKFISLAQARGVSTADEKHKLFPIPQAEQDANNLIGDDGY